jgi:hypothetical protein
VGSHLKLFLRFRLDWMFLWPGKSIEQQASSLFLDYYQNGNFLLSLLALVFHHEGRCHWLCQATRFAAFPAIVAHVTCGARVIVAEFFCCCLCLLLLFALAMLTVTIVAIIVSSVQPVAPALVGKLCMLRPSCTHCGN